MPVTEAAICRMLRRRTVRRNLACAGAVLARPRRELPSGGSRACDRVAAGLRSLAVASGARRVAQRSQYPAA
jgi:hypothetical protein